MSSPEPGEETFDPYAILAALDRERAYYIVVGAVARVVHGAPEVTDGIDITPSASPENLRKLDLALEKLNAHRADGRPVALETTDFTVEPVVTLTTDAGEVKVIPSPEGTRGYDDLRRGASRQPVGRGLRPSVASPEDLARMLNALRRDQDIPRLRMMRRLIELDRGLTIER